MDLQHGYVNTHPSTCQCSIVSHNELWLAIERRGERVKEDYPRLDLGDLLLVGDPRPVPLRSSIGPKGSSALIGLFQRLGGEV